jgi:hypothetical protein
MFGLFLLLVVASGFCYLYWRYGLSIQVLAPDEVGMISRLGVLLPKVYQGGPVFVPYWPFKWKGHYLRELVIRPKTMFEISYEGKQEHRIWSSDHQLLLVELSVYMRFPFNDPPALMKMIQASIPFTKEGLKNWMEEEVIRVARQVMSTRGYQVAIEGTQSDEIATQANEYFSRPDGLLVRSGVYGTNVKSINPGEGEVTIRIEQVLLTPELQAQLEAVESSKLKVTAANSLAEADAARIGGPIDLLMAKWVKREADSHGVTVKEAMELLKKDGTYHKQMLLYKDLLLADEDKLEVTRIEIGAPDGTPINGNLPPLAAMAALFGGRLSQGFGGNRSQAKDAENKDGKKGRPSREQMYKEYLAI